MDLEPLVVDLIKKDAIKVPPYPAVAMRLQKLVAGGQFGTPELERIVGEDQVLTATLLRYVNSARYRGVSQITALKDAISRIGAAEVCRIALAISAGAEMTTDGPLAELRRRAWRQSVMSAACVHLIAGRRKLPPDEAFVCGLLHDFGRLVAIGALEDILERDPTGKALPADAWEVSVDRFHVELGLVMAARWNLPPLVCAVISAHHQPELAGQDRPMVDAIIAADAVVNLLEEQPTITEDDLRGLGCLSGPDEIAGLLSLIARLAGTVAVLDELGGPAAALRQVPSRVSKPATCLAGTPKDVSFPVAVVRSSSTSAFRATGVTPGGLAFVGKTALKENNVVRLRLEPGGPPVEVWTSVGLCLPHIEGFRIEARLFALDRDTQAAWDRFYQSVV